LTYDRFAGTIIEYSGAGKASFYLIGEGSAGLAGDLYAEMTFGVGFLTSSDNGVFASYGVFASLFY